MELPQGTLDLLILKAVALEPQHGWAISERLHHLSSASLQIRQGWGSRFLVRQLSTPGNTVFLDMSIDGRLAIFTVAITALTTLVFGTAPALRASREPLARTHTADSLAGS
jgi:hypothetical protein